MVEIVWLASVGVGLKVCLDGLDMWCSFVCLFLSSKGVLGCMRGRGQSREGNGGFSPAQERVAVAFDEGVWWWWSGGMEARMGSLETMARGRGAVDEGDDG
jgi:hypothetical protein